MQIPNESSIPDPEAEDFVLVSNTAQTKDNPINVTSARTGFASSFTTGRTEDGNLLTAVLIRMGSFGSGDDVTVVVYSDSGTHDNHPDTALYTLINPDPLPSSEDQLTLFTAPDDAALEPNTKYWLAVEHVSGTFAIARTDSTSQTGRPGWEIGDITRLRGTATWSTSTTTSRLHLMFAVRGTIVDDETGPAPRPDESTVPAGRQPSVPRLR